MEIIVRSVRVTTCIYILFRIGGLLLLFHSKVDSTWIAEISLLRFEKRYTLPAYRNQKSLQLFAKLNTDKIYQSIHFLGCVANE